MTLSVFLELVEFKAKTASILPFFIGICYSWYNYQSIHLGYVLLYFAAMLIFNMAVDILDNYNDYHHATEVHDYKEKTNIIDDHPLSPDGYWVSDRGWLAIILDGVVLLLGGDFLFLGSSSLIKFTFR